MSDDIEAIGAEALPPTKFVVAGISLTTLRKQLKPAIPKKRQESSTTVQITVSADNVSVALPGAAIRMAALASVPFVAEVPWMLFKNVLTEPFEDGALMPFEFAAGSFKVVQITTRSPQIILHRQAAMPPIPNPLDAPLGLPLLGAYSYIRKYGLQRLIANQAFVEQQVEVDNLLAKADRLLRPLGITRSNLERLLDQKLGLSTVNESKPDDL